MRKIGLNSQARSGFRISAALSLGIVTGISVAACTATKKEVKPESQAKFSRSPLDYLDWSLTHHFMNTESSPSPAVKVCLVSHDSANTDADFSKKVSKAAEENVTLALTWWTTLASQSPRWPHKAPLKTTIVKGPDCKSHQADVELHVYPDEESFSELSGDDVSHYKSIDKQIHLNTYDVFEPKIMAHELGHAFGLKDLYEPALTENRPQPDALMNNTVFDSDGTVFREDDRAGLFAVIDAIARKESAPVCPAGYELDKDARGGGPFDVICAPTDEKSLKGASAPILEITYKGDAPAVVAPDSKEALASAPKDAEPKARARKPKFD